MDTMLNEDEIVVKVFNNNIILVNSKQKEKILFAKGIGFAKKAGQIIEKGTIIDKVFYIEDDENRTNFRNMVEKIDNKFFCICEEAIYEISKKVDKELNENVHIGLIDHLYFTVKRMRENQYIDNPFLVEIETLYKKEFELAEIVASRIAQNYDIKLPRDEIAFITLHIHSALNDEKTSNTLKNSYLVNKIVNHVEETMGIKIDTKSLDYARFLTHIKFAIKRILEKKTTKNLIKEMIMESYKESYNVAIDISNIISDELNVSVTDDEIAFLAIHLERFRISI